ncbi:MAG: nuclear transport factor 2 family protein [Candidatus Acidiferrales bacterium]
MKRTARNMIAVVFFGFTVPIVLAGQRASAHRDATSATQQTIKQLEQRWLTHESDPAVLDSILADDFIHVLPQGFFSKQEQISFLRAHPLPRLAAHKFEKLDVRVYGSVAIANGIVLSIPEGTKTPQKTFFTDVFAFRQGRWQAVNAQELRPIADAGR